MMCEWHIAALAHSTNGALASCCIVLSQAIQALADMSDVHKLFTRITSARVALQIYELRRTPVHVCVHACMHELEC